MTSPGENDLSQHIEAIRSNTDASAVDAAVRALEPYVRETARRVCCYHAVPKQLANDFVDDAPSGMLAPRKRQDQAVAARVVLYDPASGSFAGWLWTTLGHLLVDEVRKAARKNKHEQASAELGRDQAQESSSVFESTSAEITTPFGGADLERISAWRVRDRLRLLACSELWPKVPLSLWEGWCHEADVPAPFPPTQNNFEHWDDWLAALADAMHESRAAIRQHWYRKRKLLAELDYVRELRDEE